MRAAGRAGAVPGRSGVAIVTGADRPAGIGAAIARRLAQDGWTLLATLRPDPPEGGDHAASVRDVAAAAGVRIETLPIDLADAAAPARVLDAAGALGVTTALIGCAAVSERDGWERLDASGFDRALAVNARAHALLATGLVRRLPEGRSGRIVLMTSGQGRGPMPDELAYAASKGALEALVASLAPPFAARATTINAIDPGPTDTGWMTDAHRADAVGADGRVGTPEDVVGLTAFLLSDGAARLTGQVLRARAGA